MTTETMNMNDETRIALSVRNIRQASESLSLATETLRMAAFVEARSDILEFARRADEARASARELERDLGKWNESHVDGARANDSNRSAESKGPDEMAAPGLRESDALVAASRALTAWSHAADGVDASDAIASVLRALGLEAIGDLHHGDGYEAVAYDANAHEYVDQGVPGEKVAILRPGLRRPDGAILMRAIVGRFEA